MGNQNENRKPTFIDQAFAIIEEHYANEDPKAPHGMSISDHKLNCKVLDAHEGYIEGLIDERILKTIQSKELAEKVAVEVYGKLSKFSEKLISDVNEVIEKQWIRVLDEKLEAQTLKLNNTMSGIADDIINIKDRLSTAEEKVGKEEREIKEISKWKAETDKWKDRKKLRIDRMEIELSMLQPEMIKKYSDEIHEAKPVLNAIVSAFKWWKIALYIMAVALVAVSLLLLLHRNGLVKLSKSNKQVKNEWVDKLKTDQARGYSIIERGSYIAYPKTAQGIDSLENEQIKSLIK